MDMQGAFGSIVFIVCRESVEALLVLGILNAWLGHNLASADAARGRRFLWLGAGAGMTLAILLGLVILGFESVLPEEGGDYVQAAAVLTAAALILQMVFWMRRHGGGLKRQLEDGARRAALAGGGWGLFVLALIAVAREGSETVIFLYGVLAGAATGFATAALAVLFGLVVAALLYGLLQLGRRRLSWRLFFRVTETMLLFLAASLVMTGADTLVSLGVLPVIGGALWDSTFLLDDGGRLGGTIAALTGYRARPDLIALVVYGLYWSLVLAGLGRMPARRAEAAG